MRQSLLSRILQLIGGLFLFSLGSVLTINAHLGYAPWDVFHVGLAKTVGISIGNASIIVGIAIVILSILLGEKFGLGTILNMVLIGIFLDIILSLSVISRANDVVVGISMLVIGLFFMALGTCFYLKSAMGAGPRDSLMVALKRKTGLPIGMCRGIVEILAVIIGWRLGGMVGIGTVISAFTIGFWIQVAFKLFKFDAVEVKHETIDYTCKMIFRKINEKRVAKAATKNVQ